MKSYTIRNLIMNNFYTILKSRCYLLIRIVFFVVEKTTNNSDCPLKYCTYQHISIEKIKIEHHK